MAKTKVSTRPAKEENYPLFLTPEQASKVSGLGINKIRALLEERKIDFLPNGKRKLILLQALLDYYEREKIPAIPS